MQLPNASNKENRYFGDFNMIEQYTGIKKKIQPGMCASHGHYVELSKQAYIFNTIPCI
jgi:hypothetical protein